MNFYRVKLKSKGEKLERWLIMLEVSYRSINDWTSNLEFKRTWKCKKRKIHAGS